ncbi:MAG: bifunctional 4-hydroxy-3-methylbut-2-enyl diphosphate reductase/30S ribosomal protein S1 [Ruminococcaceae bacterium]|nr:bifunctional 4-hydroxy-3-methylbut-2-enyl diphosphate reductase/30S ribosomal protein S1 [Oscillospiraceae bacterium]
MKITVSEYAGFCFGVKRAADLIEETINNTTKTVYTLGDLIHNEDYIKYLESRGVKKLESEEELSHLTPEDSLVFIRAHGALKQTYEKLESLGIEYVDTTCPFVKKIWQIAIKENKVDDPYFIVVGNENHPEIQSICSFIGKMGDKSKYVVVNNSKELEENVHFIPSDDKKRKVVIAQTTQNINEWKICVKILKKLYTNLTFFDTICSVTQNRQEDAKKIAKKSDLMVIIGGKNSSNTGKLYKVSSEFCDAFWISGEKEITPDMIKGKNKIGITAGASTPDRIIQEVINKMAEITNAENTVAETNNLAINDNMSFEEMLDMSFKTLTTGEKVTGVITSVSPAEIHVDLGVKHTGILTYDEITDDPSLDVMSEFHVGDEITVLLMKFNDQEGTVQVSKKKIDYFSKWVKVEEAYNAGEVLEGKVIDVVKGGVVVIWNGIRIFIPASQTGVPMGGDLTKLASQTVRFKLIEADQQKRRAVGSIKVVVREERRAIAEKFWSEIEEGKKYTGKVKSLTSFGVFLDLGGVDGMLHITELSWLRLKHPSQVVNVGDELEVFVKAFDKENNRISLGYKTDATNPWKIFNDTYKVEDTARVKIVNMMPFGAFAEIVPGVDGLIHISQISNTKINKPEDVLKLGEEVEAKIIEIDDENQKVSLSIRALLPEETVEEKEEAPEEEVNE